MAINTTSESSLTLKENGDTIVSEDVEINLHSIDNSPHY